MIEGLKPYAEYKESGSKWLGKAPSQWEAVPLGRPLVQRIEQNRPVKTKDILSLSLRQGVIPYSEKKSGGNKAKDDLSAYTLAYPGDIVMNSMNVVVGSVGLSKYFGAVSPVYYVLHTRNAKDSILFFDALFQDKTFQQSLWGLGNGILFLQSKTSGKFNTIRMRIPMHALRRVVIPLPPPDEQAAIVRFLDHANRKIDGFIRAKRKLIGLLNEQKQAIIQSAISKVSTSDCRTMPVRAVLRPVKRMGFPDKTLLSLFRDYGVIPKDSRENKNADVRDLSLCQLVNPGDVVMNKMKAWQGSIAVSGIEGIVSPDYMVLKFQIDPIVKDFFHYALRSPSMVANYRKQAYGVRPGQWRLMYPDFCRLRLPVPTIEVQHAIVEYIKSETNGLNAAAARTEREIALMQEYRTRLTADVVTGKLDVRDAAARLPDHEAERAALMDGDPVSGDFTEEQEFAETEEVDA